MDSDFYQTINANVVVADHDFSDFDEKVTEAMQIWAANHPHPHVPVVAFAFDFGQGDKMFSPLELAYAMKNRTEDGLFHLKTLHHFVRRMGPGSEERVLYMLTRAYDQQ